MLAADNLLKVLNDNDNDAKIIKPKNEDHDLAEVLSYFSNGITKHKLRYSDRTEDYFSFD